MAGCYFYATGKAFDVNAFANLSLSKKFVAGAQSGTARSGRSALPSLQVEICEDHDATFDAQLTAAAKFVVDNEREIRELGAFPGVEKIGINFGVYWLEDTAAYPLELPRPFVEAAGSLGLSIMINLFAAT